MLELECLSYLDLHLELKNTLKLENIPLNLEQHLESVDGSSKLAVEWADKYRSGILNYDSKLDRSKAQQIAFIIMKPIIGYIYSYHDQYSNLWISSHCHHSLKLEIDIPISLKDACYAAYTALSQIDHLNADDLDDQNISNILHDELPEIMEPLYPQMLMFIEKQKDHAIQKLQQYILADMRHNTYLDEEVAREANNTRLDTCIKCE